VEGPGDTGADVGRTPGKIRRADLFNSGKFVSGRASGRRPVGADRRIAVSGGPGGLLDPPGFWEQMPASAGSYCPAVGVRAGVGRLRALWRAWSVVVVVSWRRVRAGAVFGVRLWKMSAEPTP